MSGNFKETANTYFKDAQTVPEGVQTRAQYEIDAHTDREKTARLSSPRLAKQAAEVETGVKPIIMSVKPSL